MSRMEFLHDVRQSGFETTRMNVVGVDAAIAASREAEAEKTATAKAK